MSIVDGALGHRATVFFMTAALVLLGLSAYNTLPREKFPDINVPVIFVTTVYPGAAPEEVEKQLTQPLEREIAGIDGLKKLTSRSMESLSLVSVEFTSGTDVDAALAKVRDRVDLARADFPEEAEESILEEISFSQVPILQVHLSGDVGPVILKRIAEDLQDDVEGISGVLSADLVGLRDRQVRVEVDPERLRLYGLSLDDVVDAVRDENVSIPGGDMDLGDLTYAVRVPGEVQDPLDVADFVVSAQGGRPIYVRDVADVRFGFEDRASYARIDGRESVALLVQKRLGANVVDVSEKVRSRVEARSEDWPAGLEVAFLAEQSLEIRQQVRDLENSILSGLLLVVIVLVFALGLRTSIFVGLSIPFSMLLTFVVVQLTGITLNMVVLFSMVLAVGMLVDNAVVVIENIYRHMQEGAGRLEAAGRATREVSAAIAVSTFTTVGAFAPLIFWPGVMGDFMSYLPITVSLALLSSLVVAFTINPVLCSAFMRVVPNRSGGPSSWLTRRGEGLATRYRRLLGWSLDHPARILVGTFVLFALVLVGFARFNSGIEFFTEEKPNQIKVDANLRPGTRIEKTNAVARELEARLADLPDLRVMSTSVGEGSQKDDFGDAGPTPNAARLTLDLVPRGERTQDSRETLAQARDLVGEIPGVELRVDRLDDGLPTGPPVSIEIAGDDFEVLGGIAARIRGAIEDIPGLVSLEDDFDLERPEVRVHLDRIQASRLGLTMANVAGTIRTAVNGTEASKYRVGDEEVDIVVRLQEGSRSSLEDLARLTVVGDSGDQVPVSSLARIERTSSLLAINHKERRRVVTISGQVTSTNLAEPVRQEALRRVAEIPDLLPAGYSIELGGQQQEEEEAKAFLSSAFLYAVVLVLALMVGKFDSFAIPAIIVSSVGMSMFGVLIGLLVTGLPFSIVLTGVGVISLAGIVVNNAIVLLDYAEQLRARGLPRREVVMTTGLRRLRPVLLTATTTVLGLLPLTTGFEIDFRSLSISLGSESGDYWRSMGVAVIFGLGFATFLTLIVVPVLYDLLLRLKESFAARRKGTGDGAAESGTEDGAGSPDFETAVVLPGADAAT
ncbi:MAG: efflux RND transporter permease subunit [Acidobacteriota bacterium]